MTPTRTISALTPMIALSFLFATSASAQTSHFVHPVAGTGTDLQAVIDAAADGDTLLLQSGHYGPVVIDGKGLTLIGQTGQQWISAESITIRNTTAAQTVTIADITTNTPLGGGAVVVSYAPGIVIDHCAGSVRLIDIYCHLYEPDTHPLLTVNESQNVVLNDVHFNGPGSPWTPTAAVPSTAGEGIRVTHSRIALYSCTIQGSAGTNGFTLDPCGVAQTLVGQQAGAGITLDAESTLFVFNSGISGGKGGNGVPARCDCTSGALIPGTDGLDGAPAIRNESGSSVTRVGGGTFGGTGGLGGNSATCSGTPGGAGLPGASGLSATNPIQVLGSPKIAYFVGPRFVRAGDPITLQVTGVPGTTVQLGLSPDTQFVLSQAAQGVLTIGPSGRRGSVGVIPPSGILTLQIPAGLTIPGAQSEQWHLQAFASDASGLQIGPVCDVTVFDTNF